MKREELLAWIGIVLAVPPVVYMVAGEGKITAGVFVVLLVSALVREYTAARRNENRPVFTVLHVKKRLEVQDENAEVVEFEQAIRLRVNHPSALGKSDPLVLG